MAATYGSVQKDSPEYQDHKTATVENSRRKGGEKRLEKRGTSPPPSASGLLRRQQGAQGGGEVVFGWRRWGASGSATRERETTREGSLYGFLYMTRNRGGP
jgi:hypothetical protein